MEAAAMCVWFETIQGRRDATNWFFKNFWLPLRCNIVLKRIFFESFSALPRFRVGVEPAKRSDLYEIANWLIHDGPIPRNVSEAKFWKGAGFMRNQGFWHADALCDLIIVAQSKATNPIPPAVTHLWDITICSHYGRLYLAAVDAFARPAILCAPLPLHSEVCCKEVPTCCGSLRALRPKSASIL